MIKKRPTTAREVTAFALFSMQEEGAWSDGALHQYLQRATLSARDAALATHICYGVIQNRAMLDFYLAKYTSVRLKKIAPRVLTCLQMGVYQLVMMQRIPVHAAVAETVQIISQYAHANQRTVGFANGLLRAVARAMQTQTLPVLNCASKEEYYALRYSHPEWLVRCWSEELGQKEAGLLCAIDNEIAPLSLRVNLQKTTTAQVVQQLEESGIVAHIHPRIANIVLCEGGNISQLPLFCDGLVTVQDGAGAVCVDVLEPQEGALVIDCCAAPGGKSFYMAERMKNTGKIIACDMYAHKLDKIEEGAQRLGLSNIETRLADATKAQADLHHRAAYVLCDVPCSGLGIIRKKPEIRYKEQQDLQELPHIQRAILENCCHYVQENGILVYSTCTVRKAENEEVIAHFLANHAEFEAVAFSHPACGMQADGQVTLLPNRHETDGFFIAKLRRRA